MSVCLLATVAMITSFGVALGVPVGAVIPTLPQNAPAQSAAEWLGDQFTPQGFIPLSGSSSPDLSATVNGMLALAAANVDGATAEKGLAYLEANSAAYITANGSDGPGQLSLLILDAHALGADPTDFGGTDLVSRLLATEQTSGPAAGRFGTNAQVADYNAGPYDQGLALAALKAAGVSANAAAVSWLQNAQCPDGGWTAPDPAINPCDGNPIDYAGPDTNTTSLALEGLAAQGGLTPTVMTNALGFLTAAQDPDGGWGYDPNPSQAPGNTDPDSTSLVLQALLAMGLSPNAITDQGASPVSALLSFVIPSGPDAGAISSPFGSPTAGNVIATYQSVPALAGLSFPFNPPATPTVTSLAPNNGSVTGGTSVVITGAHLSNALSVSFGSVAASAFSVNSDTSITAIAPAGQSTGPVAVSVVTFGGASPGAAGDQFTYVEPTSGPYSPLTPQRICDTRAGNPSGLSGPAAQCNGPGNAGSTIPAGGTLTVNVAGNFGVPSDATAAVLNVTSVNAAATGYLTVFPAGEFQPGTSNVNYTKGAVVPNLVEVGIGTDGDIAISTRAQSDVLVDLEGYVAPTALRGAGSGLYHALPASTRLCDTRAGNPSGLSGSAAQCNGGTGNPGERLSAGGTLSVQVTGTYGSDVIPAGTSAAVLNVTSVGSSARGHLIVYPRGASRPVASTVNDAAGQTTGNRVIVPLSSSGKIDIFSSSASDVVVDVSGYFSAAGGSGTQFNAEPAPIRMCDTRPGNPSDLIGGDAQCNGTDNVGEPIGPGQTLSVDVTGRAGVPTDATAVVVNLTGVGPSAQTHLTVYPALPLPTTSDLNVSPGQTRANLTVATLSPTGTISIYNNSGSTNVVVDVLGWYS
ncbi:MAG: IPT/TIG domain-containing protein [Acidimicrobiales bacterium]